MIVPAETMHMRFPSSRQKAGVLDNIKKDNSASREFLQLGPGIQNILWRTPSLE